MSKVLLLTDCLANGGAERQLALLIKYLPHEWERRVWSMDDGPYTRVIRDYGVQVDIHQRSHRYDVSPALDLWHVIKDWRPDVVHSWGWMCSISAGPICKALKVPLINCNIRMGMKPLRREFGFRLGMIFAARVIANSKAGLAAWNIKPERGRVVYNGFDPERLVLCQRQHHEQGVQFSVVMTGRMSADKDYRSFFLASRILSDTPRLAWHFMAVGNGPDHSNLRRENLDLITAGRAEIMDGSIEVLPIVSQAEVGVLLSPHGEGCSNSILEYMACGLPVICSEDGGNRELVVDGETGFIVPPPSDIRALAERLLYLREHQEEGRRMGDAGKQRLLENFSIEKMVDGMLRVYAEVL